MLELKKKMLHMNQWRSQVTAQIALDEDFIVPDTMEDMEQIVTKNGEVQEETVKNQGEKVYVKGTLEFMVLYRKEGGGFNTLSGHIPWEEIIQMSGLSEKDLVYPEWILEDLEAGMINSRKLNIKAVITIRINADAISDTEAAVDITGGDGIQVLKSEISAAPVAVCKKDTYRIHSEITLPGNKPNIDRILWNSVKLQGMELRPEDGSITITGEMPVFIIYEDEGHSGMLQWVEESVSCNGELRLPEADAQMIPFIRSRIMHKDMEVRPDADGEMRVFELDAVLEFDIRLCREEKIEILKDVYDIGSSIIPHTAQMEYNKILAKNSCKRRLDENMVLPEKERILQICHCDGEVKVDEITRADDMLNVEGVLEATVLYMTDSDAEPVKTSNISLPFACGIEVPGIDMESRIQMNTGIDQLGAAMTGANGIEIRALITLEALVMEPVSEEIIESVEEKELDLQEIQKMPGITGYVFCHEDRLWDVARKFHTTVEEVMKQNNLTDHNVKEGTALLFVKDIADMHMPQL